MTSRKRKRAAPVIESLNGVPEWQLRQDTSEFVERLRDRITRYVMLSRSRDPQDRRDAIAAMNLACDALEERVYDVLEDALFAFSRTV